MSEGHTLAALRYPATRSPSPAVVLFTPYRKEGAWLTYPDFATHEDYEVFVVDVRATGGSGGVFDGPMSAAEIDDAVELLAWVARQSFCDGNSALIGSSYSGLIQYHIAARKPPSLRCIAPSIAPLDNYRDMTHRGGIPTSMAWYASTYASSGQVETTTRGLRQGVVDSTDPYDGPVPASRSATPQVLDQIDVPTLCLGGLYDIFSSATVTAFDLLRSPKRLLLGDWGHETTMSQAERTELTSWLAHWLRAEGEDPTAAPNVITHRAGDRSWHRGSAFPLRLPDRWIELPVVEAPTEVPVVVVLDAVPPPTSTPMSDPTIDATIDSGMRLWGEAWTVDLSPRDAESDLFGVGTLSMDLLVTECADLDLHARLSLVRTDKSVEQVAEARLRATHRRFELDASVVDSSGSVVIPARPHRRADALDHDGPTGLLASFTPLSLQVAAGECLRLGVTLVRADSDARPTTAVLLPSSQLRLPRTLARR